MCGEDTRESYVSKKYIHVPVYVHVLYIHGCTCT